MNAFHMPPGNGERLAGKIKWFNRSKGFGFIVPNDGSGDVFLPLAVLERSGYGEAPDGADITFEWEDGHRTVYRARDLRLRCRCALCIEEMTGRKLLDPAAVAEDVVARAIDLVGQYAIAIRWSDGHSTGIHNFRDLREGCPCQTCSARP